MSSFEIEGNLHKKFPTDQKTDKFQAREFVITIEDSGYQQFIKFQLTQDRCDLIENIPEGENIKVYFDLRGREWNEKYFTNLNAWKIESATSAAPDEQWPEPQETTEFGSGNAGSSQGGEEYEEDYPF